MITKNCPNIPKFRKYSSIVLTVIHTFGPLIEQLSLAIEIIVKCSHAGPSNKSVNGHFHYKLEKTVSQGV